VAVEIVVVVLSLLNFSIDTSIFDILKDTRYAFFTPDSLPDEPIIVLNNGKEEVEVAKDKDTEATSHDKEELEQAKVKVKAEVASMKDKHSYLDINQLTELLHRMDIVNLLEEEASQFESVVDDVKEYMRKFV
nr:hypothetical protein [Tanacetum cinerariifolium]